MIGDIDSLLTPYVSDNKPSPVTVKFPRLAGHSWHVSFTDHWRACEWYADEFDHACWLVGEGYRARIPSQLWEAWHHAQNLVLFNIDRVLDRGYRLTHVFDLHLPDGRRKMELKDLAALHDALDRRRDALDRLVARPQHLHPDRVDAAFASIAARLAGIDSEWGYEVPGLQEFLDSQVSADGDAGVLREAEIRNLCDVLGTRNPDREILAYAWAEMRRLKLARMEPLWQRGRADESALADLHNWLLAAGWSGAVPLIEYDESADDEEGETVVCDGTHVDANGPHRATKGKNIGFQLWKLFTDNPGVVHMTKTEVARSLGCSTGTLSGLKEWHAIRKVHRSVRDSAG